MPSRDERKRTLKCPKCGHSGVAEVSENDYPFMKTLGFTFDKMPDGFEVVEFSDMPEKYKLRCKCGETFRLKY
jgi:hypothetical protein